MNPCERYQGIMALVRMMNYTMWNNEGSMPASVDSISLVSDIPSGNKKILVHELLRPRRRTGSIVPSRRAGSIRSRRRFGSIGPKRRVQSIRLSLHLTFLFSEAGKKLGKLLELTFKNIASDANSLLLLYEELALVFSPQNPKNTGTAVDHGLLIWLGDKIQRDFQNNFIVDSCPGVTKGFSLVYAECLNQPEENQSPDNNEVLSVAVNLCAYLTNPNLLTIFAQLNLLKNLIILRYNDNFDQINALLGCALVLPKHFDQPDKLMSENIRMALDIHFLAANWFREIINAFVTSRHPMIRRKVLLRLLRLIEIEANIKMMLTKTNNQHQSPQCFFKGFQTKDKSISSKRSTKKKSTKRGSKLKIIATRTNANKTCATAIPEPNDDAQVSSYNFTYTTEVFRGLEFGLLDLLQETFTIVHPIPEENKGKGIHLSELRFILEDTCVKLEEYLGLKNSYQEIHTASEYIQEFVVKALPHLMSHLSKMVIHLNFALESVEFNLLDEKVFDTEINYIKSLFTVLWKILMRLFSWLDFNKDDCAHLLEKTCTTIIQSQTTDESELEINSLNHVKLIMITFVDTTLDMYSALNLYRLVKTLDKMCSNQRSSPELAKRFVSREWRSFDNKKEEGKELNKILKEFFDDYATIMEFYEVEQDLIQIKEKLGQIAWKISSKKGIYFVKYPNIDGKNFLLLYNGIGSGLVYALKKALREATDDQEKLQAWSNCFELANEFKFICQKLDKLDKWNAFLTICLKVLKVFVDDGIELIKLTLRTHPEENVNVIKMMQKLKKTCNQLCNTATVSYDNVNQF